MQHVRLRSRMRDALFDRRSRRRRRAARARLAPPFQFCRELLGQRLCPAPLEIADQRHRRVCRRVLPMEFDQVVAPVLATDSGVTSRP